MEDPMEAVVKEKKVKALPKEKKPRAGSNVVAASHPSYLLMVKDAIGSLKERTGSSQYAIAKYLEEMYKSGLPLNFKKILSVQLRNMTKQGKVYKVKNSFKLSDDLKKPVKAPKSIPAIKGSKEIQSVRKPAVIGNPNAMGAVAKPVKAPKPGRTDTKSAKVPKAAAAAAKPRKATPATATKKAGEKLTAPRKKPAANNAPSLRKATPKKKGPKSLKTVKAKTTKRATGKARKAVASPAAKKAKK
ncbi:unnamed protein product [Sphagnum troendelagicum]|uniref:H15 domain-containing protein n=1 Tax=Sphagnum troendelagicum TaxID=128251 RepID=A0ABP0TML8_9BRYO